MQWSWHEQGNNLWFWARVLVWFCDHLNACELAVHCQLWGKLLVQCGSPGGTWMENWWKPRHVPVAVLPLFWNQHHPSCLWYWICEIMQQYRLRRPVSSHKCILQAACLIHLPSLRTHGSWNSSNNAVLGGWSFLPWISALKVQRAQFYPFPPTSGTIPAHREHHAAGPSITRVRTGFWRTIFECTSLQLQLGKPSIAQTLISISFVQRSGDMHFSDKGFIYLKKKHLKKLWNLAYGFWKSLKWKKRRNGQASNSSDNPGWRQGHAIPISRLLFADQFSSTPAQTLVTVASSVVYYQGFHTSWATEAHLKSTPAQELMSYLATACICNIEVVILWSVAIKVWH